MSDGASAAKKTTYAGPRREENSALGDTLHTRVGRVELVASSPCAVDRRRRGMNV